MKLRLLFILIVMALLASASTAESIIERWEGFSDTINDYTCRLHNDLVKGSETSSTVWEYRYLEPGYIYMESIEGDRLGSKAFYDPETEKTTGRRGGMLRFVKLTLPLTNSLVQNIRGITIAESPWFHVMERLERILKSDTEVTTGETDLDTLTADYIEVKGIPVEEFGFTRAKILFAPSGRIIGFKHYENGVMVEDVLYKDVKINTGLKKEDLMVK
ncbi:MAG: hypothetical protein R6U31_06820 [bacterium]